MKEFNKEVGEYVTAIKGDKIGDDSMLSAGNMYRISYINSVGFGIIDDGGYDYFMPLIQMHIWFDIEPIDSAFSECKEENEVMTIIEHAINLSETYMNSSEDVYDQKAFQLLNYLVIQHKEKMENSNE